jgi:hypothetical protein
MFNTIIFDGRMLPLMPNECVQDVDRNVCQLRLMADYECWTLWDSHDGLRNLDPFDRPIPREAGRTTPCPSGAMSKRQLLIRRTRRRPALPTWPRRRLGFAPVLRLRVRLHQKGFDIDYIHGGQSASEPVAGE